MADFSNMFATETANANAAAAQTPTPSGQVESFSESYAADAANKAYNTGLDAQKHAQYDFVQKSLDDYKDRYGEDLPNPLGVASTQSNQAIQSALSLVRQRFADRAAAAPQPPDAAGVDNKPPQFPTDDEIVAGGIALGRQAQSAAAEAAQRVQGIGGMIGGQTAELVAAASDPLNAAAVALVPEGGVALRALAMAGAFGATDALKQLDTYAYRKAVDPNFSIGQAAGEVTESAAGGAALEVGGALAGKLLGSVWRRFVATNPIKAAEVPLAVHDAGTVAEKAEDLDANNPFKTGASGEAAHNDAVATIDTQIAEGQEPSLPDSAEAETHVRTGDVFTTVPNSLDMPRADYDASIRQRAEAIDPGTFGKVNELDNRIAQARAEMDRVSSASPASVAAQGRIDDLQSQLDAITGKRKSSPKAQALRDELSRLQDQQASIGEDEAQRQGGTVQALRENLNDLQNERAKLGPAVNDATQKAHAEAQAIGIRPIDTAAPQPATEAAPSHSGSPFAPPEPKTPSASVPEAPKVKGKSKKVGGKKAVEPPPVETPPPVEAPAPVPEPVPPPVAQPPAAAFYGAGKSVKVKYELAEARDLVTSHDADFHVNPAYPSALQPRNRGGKPAQEQVYEILNRLDPERLGPNVEANAGAPIVGPDNVVESGNGRAMALGMAYARDGASDYRAFLERSGFDTSNFKEPVLVGRRITPMNDAEREAFAQGANGSASLRMTPAEQAMSDARHLTADVTALAQRGEVTSAANRDFVRAFVAKLPQGERGGMMTADGGLSQTGVNRVRAAMVARAYGDAGVVARLFEHPDPNIKTIGHALSTASADWMKMRDAVTAGEIPAGQDITQDVMTATKSIMQARDAGRPVGEIMAQGDMFTSDTSQLAARLFFKDTGMSKFLSKADMADNLSTFASDLRTGAARGPDIFGEAAPTATDVLKGTIARTDQRIGSLIEAAKGSDAIKAALEGPKVDEGLFAQLERDIEQGNNKFVSEDENGNPTLGIADAELHDIDQQANLAKEVGACAAPAPAEAAE